MERGGVQTLKAARSARMLTVRTLAERAGVSPHTVHEVETGKRVPRPKTLRRLAAALDVDAWNLHNPARSSDGIAPEAINAVERLARVKTEIDIQGNDGRGLAVQYLAHLARHPEDWEAAVATMGEAADGLTLLAELWQGLASQIGSLLPDDESRRIVGEIKAHRLAEMRRSGVHLENADSPPPDEEWVGE